MASDSTDDALGWLLLARELARQAGDLVMSLRHPAATTATAARSAQLSIDSKSDSTDLVTSADLASQNLIFSGIRQHYPSHRLIGEEQTEGYGSLDERPTWIVDSIDGTTNFVHDIGEFAISIAMVKDAEVQVGVVYAPKSGEMFTSVRGRGAFCNDRRIRTRGTKKLGEGIVISEWGYVRERVGVGRMLGANERIMVRKTRGVRQLGCGSLDICYVGMGRADGVYCGVAGEEWHIWDYAAAWLVAKEAGAEFRTVDGGKFLITSGSMVCAGPGVLEELLEAIQE